MRLLKAAAALRLLCTENAERQESARACLRRLSWRSHGRESKTLRLRRHWRRSGLEGKARSISDIVLAAGLQPIAPNVSDMGLSSDKPCSAASPLWGRCLEELVPLAQSPPDIEHMSCTSFFLDMSLELGAPAPTLRASSNTAGAFRQHPDRGIGSRQPLASVRTRESSSPRVALLGSPAWRTQEAPARIATKSRAQCPSPQRLCIHISCRPFNVDWLFQANHGRTGLLDAKSSCVMPWEARTASRRCKPFNTLQCSRSLPYL